MVYFVELGSWGPAEAEGEDYGEELEGRHPGHRADRQLPVVGDVALQGRVAALGGA